MRQVLSRADAPVFNYSAETGDGAWFPARFAVLPITYLSRELDEDLGYAKDGYVFNMTIATSEMEKNFPLVNYPHLQDSFAFIRFYIRGDELIVVEIQSELYRHARQLKIDGVYKNWSRQLLLAFEDYAKKTFFPLHPHGRIVIAGPEYQSRRWRPAKNKTKLSPDLARLLYRDLPKKLEYQPLDIPYAFENPGHLKGAEGSAKEPIEKGSGISASQLNSSKHADRLSVKFINTTTMAMQYRSALALLITRQQQNISVPTPMAAVDLKSPLATLVPFTPLPAEMLYEGDSSLEVVHREILQSMPLWMRKFSRQTIVSLASASQHQTSEGPIAVHGRPFVFHQWVGADRHPGIFPQGAENQVMAFKGGGRRTLDDEGLARQVFATKKSNTESHRVWGGLLESHGQSEFLNHLWLFKLAKKSGFIPSIGVPIDLGWMDQVPRRSGNQLRIEPMNSFLAKDLADSPERIVQLRTFVQSPYRVLVTPQILNSVDFSASIHQIMKSLYSTYGENLRWIDPPGNLVTHAGNLDQPAAYTFLAEIYSLNSESAERILKEFAKRTLITIGFVHGLKGHLGGTAANFFEGDNEEELLMRPQALGAPSGGATQLRNVTLAGELRDLDGTVHIPGAPRSIWTKEVDLLRKNLEQFQREDLRHWQETWYQMKALVRGKSGVPSGTEFPMLVFGDPDSSILIRPWGTPEKQARSNYLDKDMNSNIVVDRESSPPKLIDPELQKFYSTGRSLGDR